MVRRLQQGDLTALDDLYHLHVTPALRTAYLITRSREGAEDAVQEAFVQVFRSIAGLRDPQAFRWWFYRIVVNCAKRQARGRNRAPVSLDLAAYDKADPTIPTPDESAIITAEAALLRLAIGELTETLREPLILRYYTGLSEQEIAEVLEIPVGTVKSRLFNARKGLAERLEAMTADGVVPLAAGGTVHYLPSRKGGRAR